MTSMNSKSYSSFTVKREVTEKIKRFLGYTSVTDFVEKAIQEKLEREAVSRHGFDSTSSTDKKSGVGT